MFVEMTDYTGLTRRASRDDSIPKELSFRRVKRGEISFIPI